MMGGSPGRESTRLWSMCWERIGAERMGIPPTCDSKLRMVVLRSGNYLDFLVEKTAGTPQTVAEIGEM